MNNNNNDAKTCAICGGDFNGYGNNPAPVTNSGTACDSCNFSRVIPARITAIKDDQVRRGILRSSINVRRKFLKKSVGTNVPYAHKIEFGQPIGGNPETRNLRTTVPLGPRPYLRIGLTLGYPALEKFYTDCLTKGTFAPA